MRFVQFSEECYIKEDGHQAVLGLFSNFSFEELKKKTIILFGTGLLTYIARYELQKNGIYVRNFVDNKRQRRYNGTFDVKKPFKNLYDRDAHYVICVKERWINQIRYQLERNGITDYSIVYEMNLYMDDSHEFNQLVNKCGNILVNYSKCEIKPISFDGRPLHDWQYSFSSTLYWHPIAKHILSNLNDDDKILEIGPGKGMLSTMIRETNSKCSINWFVFGENDFWENGKIFEDVVRGDKVYKGYIEDNKEYTSEKYDKIIMTEVMEHFVCNPIPTIRKIKKMLKPNGILYVSTPDWGHVFIYDTYKDMPNYKNEEEYKILNVGFGEGHIYQYSKSELDEIFMETGFKTVEYQKSNLDNHNYVLEIICEND